MVGEYWVTGLIGEGGMGSVCSGPPASRLVQPTESSFRDLR
jgi:hypothetical protein